MGLPQLPKKNFFTPLFRQWHCHKPIGKRSNKDNGVEAVKGSEELWCGKVGFWGKWSEEGQVGVLVHW